MAFIKIDNDDLQVLIDDTYENYVLSAVINTTTVYYEPTAEQYAIINYAGHANSAPLVAVVQKPGNAPAVPMSITRSGNTFTIKLSSYRVWGPGPVQVVIFDRPTSDAATGLLRVKNAQGRYTFDSDKKYMRVDRVFQLSGAGTVTKPADRTYAILFSSPWLYFSRFLVRWPNGTVDYGAQYDGLFPTSVTATSVSLTRQLMFYQLGGAVPVPPGWGDFATLSPGNYMFLDVTGQI